MTQWRSEKTENTLVGFPRLFRIVRRSRVSRLLVEWHDHAHPLPLLHDVEKVRSELVHGVAALVRIYQAHYLRRECLHAVAR